MTKTRTEELALQISQRFLSERWRRDIPIDLERSKPILIREKLDRKYFDKLLKEIAHNIRYEIDGIHYYKFRFDTAIIFDGGNHVLMVIEAYPKSVRAVIV